MASSISKGSSGTFIHIWHGIIVANTVCASSLKIFHHYIHNKLITAIFKSTRPIYGSSRRLINLSLEVIGVTFAKWLICSKVKQHWASSVLGWVTIWLGYSNPSIGTSFFSIQTFFKFSKIFNFDQNLKNLQFLPNFQISSTPKFEKSSNFYEMFKFLQFCPKFE